MKKKKTKNNKKIREIRNIVYLDLIICLIVYFIYAFTKLIALPTESFMIKKGKVSQEETTVRIYYKRRNDN